MAGRRESREPVSDAERERVIDLLGAHMISGRLDADELAERVDRVLSAQTHRELGDVVRDLPALPGRPLLVRATDLVSLRTHVVTYAVVSAVLVGVWAATREREPGPTDEGFALLWPFWIMLFWGILLVAQALYVLRRPLLRRARRQPPPSP